MNEAAIDLIKKWFNKCNDWQKDLFVCIWKGKSLEEAKNRAIKLIYKMNEIEGCLFVPNTQLPNDIAFYENKLSQTNLKEVAHIQGVGALKPTKSLSFVNGLNMVYGENGCGKSSYVRILKKAENPKANVKIYNNIYEKNQIPIKAILTFERDGNEEKINWNINNEKVCPIKIYDTETAKRFVKDSMEVIYEPKILSAYTNMASILEEISSEISTLIKANNEKIIEPYLEIQNNKVIKEYLNIKDLKELEKFEKKIEITEIELQELENINKNIQDNNIENTEKKLKEQIEYLGIVRDQIINLIIRLDNSNIIRFFKLKEKKEETEENFKSFIEKNKNISLFSGFGSQKWRNLWESAKEYSNEHVKNFNLSKRICILCQQNLSEETIRKMKEFDNIYKSNISQEREDALKEFEKEKQELLEIWKQELNMTNIELNLEAKLLPKEIRIFLINIFNKMLQRINLIFKQKDYDEKVFDDSIDITALNINFNKYFEVLKKRLASIKRFSQNYEEQIEKRNNILAKKWLIENKDNFNVKRNIIKLEQSKIQCKTNSITILKKELSKVIITDAYIKKFNEELDFLNPQHTIKVELVANTKKGKTFHQIVLKGIEEKKNTDDILSEGEYRVVSIAAFLADLSSWETTKVFIFDDPITSLDHKFENNVANRIINLARSRQVIVFTHRLAFAEILHRICKEHQDNGIEIKFKYIELRRNPLGEPIEYNKFNSFNFKSWINKIKTNIEKAKKLLENRDYETYDNQIKGICSDFRDLIEKSIESVLLSNVVSRYKRDIFSKKIRALKAIEDEDVEIIDEMMSKYSCFDHSHSIEKPVELPEISEIEQDVIKLTEWEKNFTERKKIYKVE